VLWRRTTRKPARGTPRVGRPAPGSVNPRTGKPYPDTTYRPGGINHALAVISEFYAYHLAAGRGPLRNPVPSRRARNGDRVGAHHNPMQPFPPGPRAPYRQKQPHTQPRAIPDSVIDELFEAMRTDRDRALLAFYLSTGARPSELLGVTGAQVDYGQQLIGVTRKRTRALQWLPASPDAFVWLRLAQRELPQECLAPEAPIWWTVRRPFRPLTYHAAHRMFERVNQRLGTNHTLHALRHTCALRMANDPQMPLINVQVLLGHARLASTQDYLHPALEEIVAHVRAHQARLTEALDSPPEPDAADGQALGYNASDLETLLGPQVTP
jgi:integrase